MRKTVSRPVAGELIAAGMSCPPLATAPVGDDRAQHHHDIGVLDEAGTVPGLKRGGNFVA